MNRILIFMLGLYASLLSLHALAETDEQLAAVEAMGGLYGIALPCNYLEQTRRIKSEMVAALPKKRYLGQLFEVEPEVAAFTVIVCSFEKRTRPEAPLVVPRGIFQPSELSL